MNNSDHAARAKKPVLPPKNRSVARPKNRKQINSIIANTTLFVFKDAMVPKIEKIKKPTKANANCVTSKPFWISGPKEPIWINQTPAMADQNKPYAPNTTDPKGLFFLKSKLFLISQSTNYNYRCYESTA